MLIKIINRKKAESFLREQGIDGYALESLLKESGAFRHELRVRAALEAASAYVRQRHGKPLPHREEHAYACALLLADAAGVGGTDGVSGHATQRHPGLDSLGKGRKNATDGPAWCAAIEEAARRMLEWPTKDGGFFPAGDNDDDTRLMFRIGRTSVDLTTFLMPAWQLTIAREGLRKSVGLPGWHERCLPICPDFPPEAWSKLCNNVKARLPSPATCESE